MIQDVQPENLRLLNYECRCNCMRDGLRRRGYSGKFMRRSSVLDYEVRFHEKAEPVGQPIPPLLSEEFTGG